MARVIGIICEYNPFHKGHKYQIDKIKSIEKDATIVAIMSGNVVQRGEFSIIDKYSRTKMALECGVDGVFEMPYPYCGSTAEIFASAGVEIAAKLGCNAIYFGVEQASIAELEAIAEIIDSPEFDRVLRNEMENKSTSYILAKEKALSKLGACLPKCANDMLGIEYIRSIRKKGINLEYYGIQRKGSFYNDNSVGTIMSASAIRNNFYETDSFMSVPTETLKIYDEIIDKKSYLDIKNVNRLLHSYILLNGDNLLKAFDTSPEMVALINQCAKDSENFIECLSSKIFTTARLKRAILYAIFDIKKVDSKPKYTFLLGADKKGREYLNELKRKTKFPIITKHSDVKHLNKAQKEQLEKSYLVDSIYNMLLKNPKVPSDAYKQKPIIKE